MSKHSDTRKEFKAEKLSPEVLGMCTPANCTMNELVVLPQDGEAGFEEYFQYKVRTVIDAKHIFSPLAQNHLMLSYPAPDCSEPYAFPQFFESPYIVARNHDFEGCFAIDISAYINKQHDRHFSDLISYMRNNPATTFVLFMYSDNVKETDAMYAYLAQYMDIQLRAIPLPTAKQLTDYTVSRIRDFSLHIEPAVDAFLLEHFGKFKVGFEAADYMVRYLKNKGYGGDLTTIKALVEEMKQGNNKFGAGVGYGY